MANPWNGKVVLEAFWWDCQNDGYPSDWYTFLAKLAPRLKDMGFDGIWTPPPCKGSSPASLNMGYYPFDYYDLGHKDQQGSVATHFGTQDAFLRLVAVAHANGLEVYPDIVLDHCDGGALDPGSPVDLTNRYTLFQSAGYSGSTAGRWPKSWLDFHSNPVHWFPSGDWPNAQFGPDICYQGRCSDSGNADQNAYMRAQARAWLVWFTKQTNVDGFRFDDVNGFPPEVIGDLLYNAMGDRTDYFCVGEYVEWGTTQNLDAWASATENRCGTFDYNFRNMLLQLVESNGDFDMGSLPNAQQQNRYKTVPFVNNHDVYRGAFWDSSGNSSLLHDQRTGDWAKNGDELAATIDPDNPRAPLAYAAAFAVDGSPQVYYEDLFVNFPPARFSVTPDTIFTRPYVANLVWCHQKLQFKAGAYKVRFQGSRDLLLIERSSCAIIGLNNDVDAWHEALIATDFGSNVELHDYSGSRPDSIWTGSDGSVTVAVPPLSYSVWAPIGIEGGFAPLSRRTTQEFQMDDDLGDSSPSTPGYGGRLVPDTYRLAGSIWVAAGSLIRGWIYLDVEDEIETLFYLPDPANGNKSVTATAAIAGVANSGNPLHFEHIATIEGYYQCLARLVDAGSTAARAYVKLEYEAPATSVLF